MKQDRRYFLSVLATIGLLSGAPSHAAVSNDELTPAEFSVLSSVINKRQPLQESDLNALRTMVKSYYARTRHYFTGQDVKSMTSGFIAANSYYYALAQSMLISWDGGQYQTTKEFDSLYRQMQQDGERKPAKLVHDQDRIRLAARHSPFETDEGGTQHRLDRTQIVNSMSQIKVAMENGDKIVSVLKEMAH
jgi:hypothetical protein